MEMIPFLLSIDQIDDSDIRKFNNLRPTNISKCSFAAAAELFLPAILRGFAPPSADFKCSAV
jgi:hypothetical protein